MKSCFHRTARASGKLINKPQVDLNMRDTVSSRTNIELLRYEVTTGVPFETLESTAIQTFTFVLHYAIQQIKDLVSC